MVCLAAEKRVLTGKGRRIKKDPFRTHKKLGYSIEISSNLSSQMHSIGKPINRARCRKTAAAAFNLEIINNEYAIEDAKRDAWRLEIGRDF